MMGHREPMKGAHEFDCLRRWRKNICVARSGEARFAKQTFNRRVRRNVRSEIAAELIILEDWGDLAPHIEWTWHDVMYQEGDGWDGD
jgi:hypothetical protein